MSVPMPGNRFAKRKDGNQREVEQTLRDTGYIVVDVSRAGFGFPDLVVFKLGNPIIWILEVKQPGEGLTDAEKKFHAAWKDCPYLITVYSGLDALRKMGDHEAVLRVQSEQAV